MEPEEIHHIELQHNTKEEVIIHEEDTSQQTQLVQIIDVDGTNTLAEVETVVVPSRNTKLTPTGKISHAKTRVYTQRYRKEWEHMDDFKDWLTSVPFQATRAYCKFCERNLHAHRLSLLKHMCTLKHQRAAVHYAKEQSFVNPTETDAEPEIEEVYEYADEDEYSSAYDHVPFAGEEDNEEVELITADCEAQESMDDSENTSPRPLKKIRLQKQQDQNPLVQAMAHIESDHDSDPNETIHTETIIDSEHSDDDCNQDSKEAIGDQGYEIIDNKSDSDNNCDNVTESNQRSVRIPIQNLVKKEDTNSTDNSQRVLYLSANGKTYRLYKAGHQTTDQSKTAYKMVQKTPKNGSNEKNSPSVRVTPSTSQEANKKSVDVTNSTSACAKSVLLRKPSVSTYVLDTTKGLPTSGLQVSLYKLLDGRWTFVHESATNSCGYCSDFSSTKCNLSPGRYKFHYDIERYYLTRKVSTIYPFIEIIFDIKDPNGTYHTPLLVSPYSYSTYRDPLR